MVVPLFWHYLIKEMQGKYNETFERNEQIKSYFDNWGSRCYVFSSELGQKYLYDKNCGMEIQSLAVNTQQMLDMNCQYVFSAVPVLNYEELGWKFEKSFTTNDSWTETNIT